MNAPLRPTCSTATISLIFGILSWFLLPFVGAVVAVISGHMARAEIRRTPGGLEGEGMATIGLVLGYAHLAVALLAVFVLFAFLGGLAFFATFAHHVNQF